MDRRLVGVVALVCLVLLAGCQSPSRGLTVGILDVEELDADGYLVKFVLRNDADAPFHDVRLRAYDSDGDLACTLRTRWIEEGKTSDPAEMTRETVCASAPAVLVPTATEPCERDPDRGLIGDSSRINHTYGVYSGFENGSYHVFSDSWNNLVRCSGDRSDSDTIVRGQPPNRQVLDGVIYRYLTTDENVSLVVDDPDRDWHTVPPSATREYSVNATRVGANGSLDRTVSASAVPDWLLDRTVGVNGSRSLNESAYHEAEQALLAGNVSSVADVPEAGSDDPATVAVDGERRLLEPTYVQRNGGWEYRGIRYGGTTTHRTIVHVETANGTYRVVVQQSIEWSGPAIDRAAS